jgi:hypothetical protein
MLCSNCGGLQGRLGCSTTLRLDWLDLPRSRFLPRDHSKSVGKLQFSSKVLMDLVSSHIHRYRERGSYRMKCPFLLLVLGWLMAYQVDSMVSFPLQIGPIHCSLLLYLLLIRPPNTHLCYSRPGSEIYLSYSVPQPDNRERRRIKQLTQNLTEAL